MVPNGEECGAVNQISQKNTKTIKNLQSGAGTDVPYAEDHYFPKGFNCPSRLDFSFRVETSQHGFSSQNDYVKGNIIIKYHNINYDLLVPTKASTGIWEINIYDFGNKRYVSLPPATTILSTNAHDASPIMRLREDEEISFSINLPSYLGDLFFAEQGTREIRISGLKTRQENLSLARLEESSGLLSISTLSQKCDPILISYTPIPT